MPASGRHYPSALRAGGFFQLRAIPQRVAGLLAQPFQARSVRSQFRWRRHHPRARLQFAGIERLQRCTCATAVLIAQAEADLFLARGQRNVDIAQDLRIEQAAVQCAVRVVHA
ncbi:hypothetical protein G6F62_015257 [Rhizopus arrhizus]|nr:hypothetical protein G6F62_015257 [Rhizopus arrhizus]